MSTDNYDDDRPGMMRVHIAQGRAQALCDQYTLGHLRKLADVYDVPTTAKTKLELALRLAWAGVKP